MRVLFGLPLRSLDCSRPTARRVLLFRSSVRAPLASAARTVLRPGLAPPGTSVAASLVVPAPVTRRLSTRASIHALSAGRCTLGPSRQLLTSHVHPVVFLYKRAVASGGGSRGVSLVAVETPFYAARSLGQQSSGADSREASRSSIRPLSSLQLRLRYFACR